MLDNLEVHSSGRVVEMLRERGVWFLLLSRYSRDLNEIEMAFCKLKAHLRRVGARTSEANWRAVGEMCG